MSGRQQNDTAHLDMWVKNVTISQQRKGSTMHRKTSLLKLSLFNSKETAIQDIHSLEAKAVIPLS